MPRSIRATISAGALAHNFMVAKAYASGAKVWAVIKANAYGHGIERAARALDAADGFAVLDFQEAARLRVAGVEKPILMLEGFFKPADIPLLACHRVAMFRDMRTLPAPLEEPLRQATASYLRDALPRGEYLAWIAESDGAPAEPIGGAGVQLRTIVPRPRPGAGASRGWRAAPRGPRGRASSAWCGRARCRA